MDLPDYANEVPPSARLGALGDYLKEEPQLSPIDMYRSSINQILAYGTEQLLQNSDFIGRLLVLGVVSSAEGYVRAILSASLELCPLARSNAAKKAANLGGALWHGKSGFTRSVFENSSFASRDELTKAYKDYVGVQLDDINFKAILDEYDSVCHLRHGIVHGDGFLPGKNAVQLDIPSYDSPVRIIVGYAQLQEIAAVVNTLVVSLNRTLFHELCKRWAIDWRRRSDWQPLSEEKTFRKVWNTFHSSSERQTRAGRSKLTCKNCMMDIRTQYGLA